MTPVHPKWYVRVLRLVVFCHGVVSVDLPIFVRTTCLALGQPCRCSGGSEATLKHDDVIKWKHFPRYGPFVRGIHQSPVNSPHKCQCRGALMFSLIWINDWVNNGETGDLRRHRAHDDVIVMEYGKIDLMNPLRAHDINTIKQVR